MFSHYYYYYFVPNSNLQKKGGYMNIYGHISYIIIYVCIYLYIFLYENFFIKIQVTPR